MLPGALQLPLTVALGGANRSAPVAPRVRGVHTWRFAGDGFGKGTGRCWNAAEMLLLCSYLEDDSWGDHKVWQQNLQRLSRDTT